MSDKFYTREMYDRDILLSAVQKAYRKHCLGDLNIGWEELSDILWNAICEVMTDKGSQSWLRIAAKNIKENK